MISSPCRSTVSRDGSPPGSRCSSVNAISRSPSGPRSCTRASSAARATAMSEGWVAMHVSGAAASGAAVDPEDRVVAGVAADGRAAAARLALVAGRRDVLEVVAAGALQRVAAAGGHVAQLPAGARQQRLRQHGVALAHPPVGRQLAVGHRGADAQAAVAGAGDFPGGEGPDVDHQRRAGDAEPEVVDQVGPAGQEHRLGIAGDGAHRLVGVGRPGERERPHHAPPADRTAGTMFT